MRGLKLCLLIASTYFHQMPTVQAVDVAADVSDMSQLNNPDPDPQRKMCRVLSLSGGGSKGAYEIGVMQTIVNSLEAPHNQYDVITGVSVGAINAAGFGLFDKGDEKNMSEYMTGLWENLTNDQIWEMWPDHPYDPAWGLLFGQGLISNKPLYNLLLKINTERTLKKRVVVSAVDSLSGSYIPFSLHEMGDDHDQKASAVLGSAAMPFVFPPVNMSRFGHKALLIDGGTVWNNNLLSGIEQCRQIPGIVHDNQIEVDVVMLIAETLQRFDPAVNATYTQNKQAYVQKIQGKCLDKGHDKEDCLKLSFMPETLKFLSRKSDIKSYYTNVDDVVEFMQTYPDVQYRYFIEPVVDLLPEYEILEFGIEYTGKLFGLGRNDTQRSIDMGPGVSFQNLINGRRAVQQNKKAQEQLVQ